ncbi:MAG: KamA family radical SAM protein [Chlamydiia bacterium]|nr:KamA family radical SAM protein [Chlamydiia bacterium]
MELWQQIVKQAFTSWEALAAYLKLDGEHVLVEPSFPLKVPRRLAEKMEKGRVDDPLLLQFLPRREEGEVNAAFGIDPVGDMAAQCTERLIQKYRGRVLVVATGACAMHCRYCFRQHYPYPKEREMGREFAHIANDETVYEVILSGGDPLSLPDRILGEWMEQLKAIPHVKRIRFHSRFPMGVPERITPQFLQLLEGDKQIYFVIHANHPREFDAEIWEALEQLKRAGVVLLNQSVLLKGVNDSVEVLKQLCLDLVDHGVIPYYLHQLDRVQGAAHFEVSHREGHKLMKALEAELPGYALPRYVQEISGQPAKSSLLN